METVYHFKIIISLCLGVMLPSFLAAAADTAAIDAEIVSRLQSMAQGTYSDADWNAVVAKTDEEIAKARAQENWGHAVDMTVIKSRALSMRNQNDEAVQLLMDVIQEYEHQSVPELKKAYLEAAEIYAKLGQEERVQEIQNRFQNSSIYDDEAFKYKGGTGPNDPILVARPSASGPNSVSLTALQVAKRKAHYSTGQPFPDFTAESWGGRRLSLADLRGQVVLVDLWLPGWHRWLADLSYRKSMYERYKSKGYQIIGMCLLPHESKASSIAEKFDIPWPLTSPDKALLKTLGIFGEASNYLLDREGIIIAKDLYGADLEAAVERAVKNK